MEVAVFMEVTYSLVTCTSLNSASIYRQLGMRGSVAGILPCIVVSHSA